MGTSNWQQIPFCIEALMKMAPSRVLDVGVGFGRWGMITREFCDVWFGRIFKDQWQVQLEGIEAFKRSITDYHREFYNKIHVGDAAELLPQLAGPWSVTIYGDVLEHFTREKANELLNLSLDRSDYVLVNIPLGEYPQDEAYGNTYERHLSTWHAVDFFEWPLVRHALLKDYIGRDYGSFVLSRKDPQGLKAALFSRSDGAADATSALTGDDLDKVLARVRDQAFELGFIKQSGSYRMATKFRKAAAGKLARTLKPGGENLLKIRPLPRAGTNDRPEVWVLGVHAAEGEPGIPWDFVERQGDCVELKSDHSSHGRCIRAHSGELSVRTTANPLIRLMHHRWSTRVEVEFNGRREIIDLCSNEPGELLIRPDRTPMAEKLPQALIEAAAASTKERTGADESIAVPDERAFSPSEQAFIERVKRDSAKAVAIHCPRWLGVTNSTRQLFEHCYAVPPNDDIDPWEISEAELNHHARVLAESGVAHLVCSGGDAVHLRLTELVRHLNPNVTVDLLWHGTYIQVGDDYIWQVLRSWMDAVKAGKVRGICTVKAGAEQFYRSVGIPSAFLQNYVGGEPMAPPQIDGDETQVGIWVSNSARKSPHAMIQALTMVPKVRVHGAGLDARAIELIEYFKIPSAQVVIPRLPLAELEQAIRRTHVSVYVTFAECCPMVPLESLQLGVPCLVGPVSHLFTDNPYLFDRLVCPWPDRADKIAQYIQRAAAEREEIVAEWQRYAPIYNEQARATVRRYLEGGPTLGAQPLSGGLESDIGVVSASA